METNTKIKLLRLLVGLCLIIICGLGYHSWQLSKKIQASSQETVNPLPFSSMLDPWPKGWDTSGRFSDLHNMMNEMMNRLSPGSSVFNNQGFGFSQPSPRITMKESAEEFTVVVSVPQGQEVELNTELSDNLLNISGKINNKTEEKLDQLFGNTQSFSTLSSSRFSQTMTLPAEIDETGMTITHGESEITIKIPKIK